MAYKIILTGATGMVGEGVLHNCLVSNDISEVVVVGRKPCQVEHPKLKEILIDDFVNLGNKLDSLSDYDACFFCLGTTSIRKTEEEYYKVTYIYTLNFAKSLLANNGSLRFCYISGSGTDSSEQGKVRWARVKGKVENDLIKLGFKSVHNFRPGMILAKEGMKNTLSLYKYFKWLVPILKVITPSTICTLDEVAAAMINTMKKDYSKNILEISDIKELAKK